MNIKKNYLRIWKILLEIIYGIGLIGFIAYIFTNNVNSSEICLFLMIMVSYSSIKDIKSLEFALNTKKIRKLLINSAKNSETLNYSYLIDLLEIDRISLNNILNKICIEEYKKSKCFLTAIVIDDNRTDPELVYNAFWMLKNLPAEFSLDRILSGTNVEITLKMKAFIQYERKKTWNYWSL